MADFVPDWFENKRQMFRDSYDMATVIHSEYSLLEKFGNYSICAVPFEFTENTWWYTKVLIYKEDDSSRKIEFIRNYGNFPFEFVKKHPKKRKYIICSEDVESITVVDLNSMKYHTWYFEDGFWPRSYHISPCGKFLAVYGSVFGDLDTIRFYDFSSPIKFPWTLIGEFSGKFVSDKDNIEFGYPSIIGAWEKNSSALRVVSEVFDEDKDNIRVDEYLIYTDGVYQHINQEWIE